LRVPAAPANEVKTALGKHTAPQVLLELPHHEPRQPSLLLRSLSHRRPVLLHHAVEHPVLRLPADVAVPALGGVRARGSASVHVRGVAHGPALASRVPSGRVHDPTAFRMPTPWRARPPPPERQKAARDFVSIDQAAADYDRARGGAPLDYWEMQQSCAQAQL
jgi:hypothetical protein